MAKSTTRKSKREHVERELRDLSVTLNPSQKNSLGRRLADVHDTIQQLDLAKKAAMAEFTSRLKQLAADGAALVTEIITGQAERPVECEICFDHEKATVTVTRTDTGEQIETRPMTDEEKQLKIPFNGGTETKSIESLDAPKECGAW